MKRFFNCFFVFVVAVIALFALSAFAVSADEGVNAANDVATNTPKTQTYMPGDVNADNVIDMFDYLLARRIYFQSADYSPAERFRADANLDGIVDSFDYLAVKSLYFKAQTPKPEFLPNDLEIEALLLINVEREKVGLGPLTFAGDFYMCAEVRANEAYEVFSHTRPDGTNFRTVYAEFGIDYTKYWTSENLAGRFKTIPDVTQKLMDSDGHRKNILWPEFTSVAICIIPTDQNYYMAQLFLG